MAGRYLGDVFVVVNADTTGFRQFADARIRKALAGFRPAVTLGADTREVTAAITGIQARIKALSSSLAKLRIGADTKQAEATVAKLQARLLALTKTVGAITMRADTTKLDAQIAAEQAKLAALKQSLSDLQMDADAKRVISKIADLNKQSAHLEKALESMTADVDIRAAEAKLKLIDAELRVLNSPRRAVQLAIDIKAAQAAVAAVTANITRLRQEAQDIRLGADIDTSKLLAAEAALLGMEHTVEQMGNAAKTTRVLDTALGVLVPNLRAAGGWWGALNQPVALFGGLLNRILPQIATTVTVWHILGDTVVEFTAILVPAVIAFGAFAFAATDAAKQIQIRLQAMHTELDATGRAIPGLSTGFESLHKAVQPQVYQLFGDALAIVKSRSGEFSTVAKGAATVVDQLAARMTYAITQGNGLSVFMRNAVRDAAGLGTVVGNIAGIFGNLGRAIPGIAESLLSFWVGFTHVLEVLSGATIGLTHWILLLHGVILWTGLAVTSTLAFVGAMANLGRQFLTFAAAQTLSGVNALKTFGSFLVSIGLSIAGFIEGLVKAEGAAAKFTVIMDALGAVNPLVWVGVAVGALVALAFWLRGSASATRQFTDGLQQTVAAAQLTQVIPTILSAQTQVTQRLSAAQAQLAQTQEYLTVTNIHTGQQSQVVSAAYTQQAGAVSDLRKAQASLSAQYSLVSGRVGGLSKEYGGQTQALGALNAAGITTAQILDTNNQHWAQALIQVEATTAAYKVMGVQAGQLGNDLDVLGRTATDQYQAVQKLNQAWSGFISDVTGTQGSLDSVLQGFSTLSDHSGTLRLSLGKLKVSYTDVHAAIDSLTPAGIALNQAFGDQITSTDKLFASWRTAGLANNLFRQGVAAAIAPLEKYANGSQEATAQLVALAEQAGYQGPISLQALNKYLGISTGMLGKHSTATRQLKDITDQATVQEALLTGAMQAQGAFIASKLIGDINEAILKYNGVEAAASAYGDAIAKDGQQSDAAKAARQKLINDIIAAGTAAGDSAGQIAAMITKVLGIPAKAALQIVMTGTGAYSISGSSVLPTPTGKQTFTQAVTHKALGGFISQGTGPTADNVPILASKGEYVVRAASVSKYGVGTMDAINAGKFAAGGLVETGNLSVLSGQYAADIAGIFEQTMLDAMVSAMRNSLAGAEQSAAAAFSGTGPSGAGVARWTGVVQTVLASLGLPQADTGTILSQIATESGGNPTIVNKWDSNWIAGHPSVGLLQVIAGTFAQYAGPLRSTGPFEYGVSVNPTANVYAGTNYAVHRYGNPGFLNVLGHGHGYAEGGLVGLASGGLAGAQSAETRQYAGLRKAFSTGLAHARPGSFISSHRKSIGDELITLAKRQAAETAAYGRLSGSGLTASGLSRFATAVREEARTAADKALSGAEPSWMSGLRADLAVLEKAASGSVSRPGTSRPGSSGGAGGVLPVPVPGIASFYKSTAALRSALAAAQKGEREKYFGLEHSFDIGLSKARKGSWLYAHRQSLKNELHTLATRQQAELGAYAALSGSGLTPAHLARLGSAARAETRTAQDQLFSARALPGNMGGHPLWDKALRQYLAQIIAISALAPPGTAGTGAGAGGLPVQGPVAHIYGGDVVVDAIGRALAGAVSPFGAARGGLVMDRGGWLRPGWNPPIYNGLGRPEPVGGAGGDVHIHLHVHGPVGSQAELETWLTTAIRKVVKTRGGGKVDRAFNAH